MNNGEKSADGAAHTNETTNFIDKTAAAPPKPAKIPFPPCRYILVAMGFFAILNVYSLRVNISVAIVDMVNATYQREMDAAKKASSNDTSVNQTVVINTCIAVVDANSTKPKEDGPFEWDSSQQLLVTGAYFYGYITTQFIGGMVSQRFGGKFVLLTGIGVTSLLTLISPLLTVAGGFPAIVVLRVLEGVFSGVCFPSMNGVLSTWAPPLERSVMSSFIFCGAQVGTVIGMSLTGVLGWSGAFYFFGCLGLVWSVMWFFLTYDTPGSHPRISAAERDYIENSIGRNKNQKKSMHVPWCAMFTSLPFYAAGVAQFTCLWGYYTLLNTLPLYFKNIMFFDIKQNGALSGAPYLAMWFAMVFSGWLADKLRAKNILSTTNVRKVYMAVGFLIPAACLVATGFVDCHNSGIAVALVIVAVGFAGPAFGAWNVNLIDIAPSYAGTMLGITNTVGTVPGFVGTLVVSAFTSKGQTVEAWRNVFYVTASIYVFGTIFYLIFGSGELQPWAVEPHKVDDMEIQSLEDGVKKKSADNGNLPEKA